MLVTERSVPSRAGPGPDLACSPWLNRYYPRVPTEKKRRIMNTFTKKLSLSLTLTCAAMLTARAAAPTPLPILHLQADQSVVTDASGNVTEWDDTTGNANNALQADTTLTPTLVP